MNKMKDSGIEWIGDIPFNWHIQKLKNIGEYINGYAFKPENWGSHGRPIIRIQDLTKNNNNPNYFLGEIDNKYLVKNGDILVSWAATLDAFIWNKGEGWLNQHIFKAIPNKKEVDYNYFYWLLKVVMNSMNNDNKHGIVMQHVTLGLFSNYKIALPPIEIQSKIANYLNRVCLNIDKLIENQDKQIENLKTYKQSLISEVVTKGLNPDVEMKDSGVEWIGYIPKHWELKRIKNCFKLRNEKNYEPIENVNLISLYTDKGVVQHDDIEETTGNRAVKTEGYKKVYNNDIVVNIILCWMGAIGMSRYEGVTSPAYDVYAPINNTNSEYYHYLFRTNRFNGECYKYGRGIMMMRWRTYSTEFSAINIPVPPKDEQNLIVDFLSLKSNQIDVLIKLKKDKIEKLNEYKKSMIYEYVTGKKEVI